MASSGESIASPDMVVRVKAMVMMSPKSLSPMCPTVPAVRCLLVCPAYSPSQPEGRLPTDHAKQQQQLGGGEVVFAWMRLALDIR